MDDNRKEAMRLARDLMVLLFKKEEENEALRVLEYLLEIAAVLNLDGMLADEIAQWPEAA